MKIHSLTSSMFFLDKHQSCFLKGIAIIIILLHNFFHWLPPRIGEHELNYSSKITEAFFYALVEHPQKIFHIIISYVGYIAISLFVFLSGYGLVKKYHAHNYSLIKLIFLQIVKVYELYLVSIYVFILFYLCQGWPIPWLGILNCLSLTNNFIPSKVFFLNGPWWFFSLIIQLYIVFPILYNFIFINKRNFAILLIGYYVSIYILTFYFNINTAYLYANFIGHIPEFSLGIFLSLFPQNLENKKSILILSIISFCGSMISSILHPFSFILGAIFLLVIGSCLYHILNKKLILIFYSIGILSPFLFGVHGFLRKPFMDMIPDKMNGYFCMIAFLLWF